MNNIKIDSRIIVGLIFVAIVLLVTVIFRGCEKSSNNKEEKKEVVKIVDNAKDFTAEKDTEIDSLYRIILEQNAELQSVSAEKRKAETAAARLRRRTSDLVNDIEFYQENLDVANQLNSCDTLKDIARVAIAEAENYEKQIRAFEYLSAQKDVYQNAQLQAARTKADTLHSALINIESKYYELDKTYLTLRKKHKRERTLSRVLAASALVIGGFLLTK